MVSGRCLGAVPEHREDGVADRLAQLLLAAPLAELALHGVADRGLHVLGQHLVVAAGDAVHLELDRANARLDSDTAHATAATPWLPGCSVRSLRTSWDVSPTERPSTNTMPLSTIGPRATPLDRQLEGLARSRR